MTGPSVTCLARKEKSEEEQQARHGFHKHPICVSVVNRNSSGNRSDSHHHCISGEDNRQVHASFHWVKICCSHQKLFCFVI